MAETMTYDPGTDTVTTEDNLTSEEQESLAVGEDLQAKQEGLLAGKYKNAEELEKAYAELEKKLGEQGSEVSDEAGDELGDGSEEEAKAEKETVEDSPAVALITEASAEYWDNDGELTSETIEKFNEMSSNDLVTAYLQMQKAQGATQPTADVPDLTQGDINAVHNSVGGVSEYKNLMTWASENISDSDRKGFDDLVSTGNLGAIRLAAAGLKAQMDEANGYEGRMLTGKSARTSGDVFRSQAELIAAMDDTRYDNDPAYRQDIIEKLDRSNIQF